MELILKETIDSLGREGDVVKVKPGYARNYLLPQGKAVQATRDNIAALEQNKAEIQARLDTEHRKAETLRYSSMRARRRFCSSGLSSASDGGTLDARRRTKL